ncbi:MULTISPECIES: PSP1 domain-containing protein [Synergistaceae]|uniref:PSP1 domain-containing protein n=1 Tax=Synergistaceae TaxID=649777 RepID=UPI003ADC0E03|nr:regulatory iron-sulfur-containing complex subunit RicT [Synergistaceae bacterium DZ-S4]
MNKYLAIFGKPRYLGILAYSSDETIEKGTTIVVESYRGEETAVVAGLLTPEQEGEYRLLRNASEHGDSSSKTSEPLVTDLSFISFATDEDIRMAEEYREEEREILKSAIELLKPHELEMKLIDVEFLRQRRKLFFYFSSEQRVDFRAYVRDLAREFKTRIELRQIGVRDEAKIIRGLGPCGQPCCCSYWLNQFAPICIKMVKEQNLALNPAKISGICGRLMCCMCYEHNVYRELWEKLPNPGTKIKTPGGNVVVSGVEVHTNNVRCYIPSRGEIRIPIDRFAEFKETIVSGKDWIIEEEKDNMLPLRPHSELPEIFGGSGSKMRKDKDDGRRERRNEKQDTAEGPEGGSKPNKKKRRPRKLPAAQKEQHVEPDRKEHVKKLPQMIQVKEKEVEKQGIAREKPRRPRRRRSGAKKTERSIPEE